ncbi:phosphoenolpyruvate hydrolase family protein [Thermoanaerobacterium sp. R66]|uniref:phosphoenolpyruvate hydrolase family protein n=1 Tax=Thermoanaerobacterium sp. R66 TaxID=2742479 RepID=UPI0023800B40|nr:phosphoenolpyruvate hydrolase family protein [Thermoanaerobacterium sp. R66]MDE4542412.1 phosphoenolpyruvate hydrolase family protein [Thermoanaerobacterium sp. R66]
MDITSTNFYTRRDEILKLLKENISNGKVIVGVAVGSGAAAKYAEEGGADFILILNAGIFRSAGVPSIASYMPFKSSNEMVMSIGETEIIPRIKKIPVIFGVCATDPLLNYDYFFNRIKKIGFTGVINYPTACLIDGQYRQYLEETGLGFENEVKFMKMANKAGLVTIAYVHDTRDAEAMAKANVDVLCINFGFTLGGKNGIKGGFTLEQAAEKAQQIFLAASRIKPDIIKLVYGGPITYPNDFQYIVETTEAQGYIGGSAIERIPVESSISETTSKFKSIYMLQKENIYLKQELAKKQGFDKIIGNSKAMQEVYDLIMKVAETDVNILITGETGTGKELVARAIHLHSSRRNGPFITVNCAALPLTLLESELFGYEKGAFTGAAQRKLGRFELAQNGTLFLDEIGEMELAIQAKLLRAIQEKEFERVGGVKTIHSDVRIISATNRDLQKAIEEKNFREDLYYRLNVVEIRVPPLRERKEDIPALVSYFVKSISDKFKFNIERISPDALQVLLEYNWPGNVRELKNVLEHAAVLSNKKIIEFEDLPSYLQKYSNTKIHNIIEIVEQKNDKSKTQDTKNKEFYRELLEKNHWNITKAAKELNISRKTLYKKLKQFGFK